MLDLGANIECDKNNLIQFALMGQAVDVGELLVRIKALEEGTVTYSATGTEPPASISTRPMPTPTQESRPSFRPTPSAPPKEDKVPARPETVESSASGPPHSDALSVPSPTAEETAHSVDSPSRGSLSFEQLSARWDELIDAVRAVQPALAIFLKGARLLALEGKSIKLGFVSDDRFPMAQVVKNRESIEAICAERLDDVLRLNCVVADKENKEVGEKKKIETSEGDPIVKSILDTFDGEIV